MRISRQMTAMLPRRRFVKGLAALGAMAFFGKPSGAAGNLGDDWTTFRNGPQLPGVAGSTLPEKLELLWEVPAKDGVVSTPAILDGKVYVGTLGGYLLCLDLATGNEIWRYRSIESTDEEEFAPGFAGPIAVTDALVFGGDDQGLFHAVDRATGKITWKFETGAEIIGGPMPYGDHIIFGSHDGKLYSFAQADGAKVWEFATEGPVNATPTISGGFTFITGCDKPVLRVVDLEKGTQHAEVPLDELLIASSSAVDDILYFGTDGGSVIALDWKNRKTLWTYAVPNREQQIHSSPAIQDNMLVIGSRDKHLHAIDRTTGQGLWKFPTRAKIDGSPVIVGDRVFFGSADKFVYGVSLKDGQQVWKHPAGQAISGSAAVGEQKLVIGTETSSGRVLCFGAK